MKKGKIINFEWMCDYNHWNPDEFDNIALKLIKKDIDTASNEGCNLIIGVYLLDGFLYLSSRYEKFIRLLKPIVAYAKEKGIEKIVLVSGQGEFIDPLPVETYFIDYNTRMLYNSYKDKLNKIPKYESSFNKFLFLTGMPNRPNRIGLLSKFYDAGLLSHAKWSFFSPWTDLDKNWCRNYLSHYDDDKYERFLKDCEFSFDERFETAKPYYGSYNGDTELKMHDMVETDWVKSPTYIDSSVYKDTWFSIVSEGPNYWGNENRFVTEKLWRVFLHKHPFILAGEPKQFDYIKYLGYKTFEDYMLIKDYAYIQNENDRFDAIVKNTQHWLENKDKYIDRILTDVEYNYNLFMREIEDKDQILNMFEKEYNIPRTEIDYYFNGIGYDTIIRKIPNGI
jgi:hypothetical protein